MKKLLFILLLISSCADDPFLSSTPEKDTTLEIVNAVDTSQTYYVVMIGGDSSYDGTLYVLNKDKVVVYKAENYSGSTFSVTLFLVSVILFFMILIGFITSD